MNYARFAFVSFALFISKEPLLAQQLPPVTVPQNPGTGGNLTEFFTTKTPYEFWLACLIGFLALTIIFTLVLTLRQVTNVRAEDIARPVVVVTVIMGTLILITVGYTNEQVAPAFGLFGTMVGYLLGRLPQSSDQQPAPQQGQTVSAPDAAKPAASLTKGETAQ
jgi:hypothetical protein